MISTRNGTQHRIVDFLLAVRQQTRSKLEQHPLPPALVTLSKPRTTSSSYLEAVLPRGDIHGSQVSQGLELGISVIPEEGQHWDDSVWMDQQFQLIETGHLMDTGEWV